ncbi:MAG: caspase family protein [Rhodobacteraceae bacterium]|nr:caspase family protein [Paracoccaceae bacterium]
MLEVVRVLRSILRPMGRIALALIVAALAAPLVAPVAAVAAPKIYTLHVGIDDYKYVPKLEGAVADAEIFADIFRTEGADVAILTDGEATLENIVTRFQTMARLAKPGDTIIFTYAGHGAQWPEQFRGEEEDGYDEFFALANFSNRGAGVREMLLDNQVAELFQKVDDEVTILFIADSCHSGTMTRSLDGRGRIGKARKLNFTEFTEEDLGLEIDDSTFGVEMGDLRNVIFVAAAQEYELANETYEKGNKPRGALSVAVEEALRGEAIGFDQSTSLGDLRGYVIDRVRNLVGARQNPDVQFDPGYLRQLAANRPVSSSLLTRGLGRMEFIESQADLAAVAASTPGTPSASRAPLSDALGLTKTKLVIEGPGAAQAGVEAEKFATIVRNRADADLLWDLERREMVDIATDDMIGTVPDLTMARRVADKHRAVAALQGWAPKRPLHTRIIALDSRLPDDVRFRDGQSVQLGIEWPDAAVAPFPHITIVNLANGGEVQYVFPAGQPSRRLSPEQLKVEIGPFPITRPFGADHVVVFASTEPLTEFHQALETIHNKPAITRFVELIDQHAAGANVRVGMTPLFTSK